MQDEMEPIHCAAVYGHDKVIKLLVDMFKVDVNSVRTTAVSALRLIIHTIM